MPLDIAGDGFSFVFRLIIRFFVEIVFEALIQGAGYLFCRLFNNKVKPDGILVTVVGLLLWGIAIYAGLEISAFIAIDSCLDAGGSYDYKLGACVT